ncbi:MAG: hypothetical protein IJR63_07060 [Synergistaceae bacterium]|nr:hypothetical protein [Synergistaceae bacterium]
MKVLLKHGTDVSARDNEGVTALALAENLERTEIARLIQDYSSDSV